jgi:hypothetical protein
MPVVSRAGRLALMVGAIAVGAVAIGVRLWLAWRLPVGFDEHWHRFIADARPLGQLVHELKDVAHPPLCVVLLRMVGWVSGSAVAARAIAVVPGVASLAVWYLAARRVGLCAPMALAGVLLLALLPSHAQVSTSVRGYALAMLFQVAAFAELLRWVDEPRGRRVPGRALLWLALGMWSEYCTVFVGAAFGVVWLFALRFHGPAEKRGRDVRDALLFGLSIVGLALYLLWGVGLTSFGHTDAYLPSGGSTWRFLLDGWARDLHLLLGVPRSNVIAALSLVGLPWLMRPPRTREDLVRSAPSLVLGVMVVLLMLASVTRRYPFGGTMRHQVMLLPFLALVIVQLIDRARKVAPSAVVVTSAFMVALAWGAWSLRRPFPDDNLFNAAWAEDAQAVRREAGSGCVYLPVYGVYAFYGGLGPSRWSAESACGPRCVQFDVEHQGQRFIALRDGAVWEPYDPSPAAFAERLRQVSRAAPRCGGEMWLYTLDHPTVAPEIATFVKRRVALTAGELWQLVPDPVAPRADPLHN